VISKRIISFCLFLFVPGILIGLYSPRVFMWYAAVITLLELGSFFLVQYLRKDFQWLITPADLCPSIDRKGLDKFIEHGYDAELGWVRKPNTEKEEAGRQGKTKYHIDAGGRRSNPGHENWPAEISCYGDSFVFCRQVNDNETFEWYLSEITKTNILNFGVGNYGLDQALLRLKRDYPSNRTKIVIMGVVPSTIVRILCVWKHYNEFGNVLGFKPRFLLENGKLSLINNIINNKEKFERYREFIAEINRYDDFYESKFKKDMLSFPYLASILSNPARNFPLLFMVSRDRWVGDKEEDRPYPPSMSIIMKSNLKLREQLFFISKSAVDLLEKLVVDFSSYCRENDVTPLFLWMPQKDDILRVRERSNYYKDFVDRIKDKLITIDLTEELIDRDDLDDLYSDDNHYGGHHSKQGNLLIAKIILNRLIKYNLIVSSEEIHV
jgi:hypothetical protein